MKIVRRQWVTKDAFKKRIKRIAHGCTLCVNGKRGLRLTPLQGRRRKRSRPLFHVSQRCEEGSWIGQAVEHYLKFKSQKRSLANDRHIFKKQL